ncbi:MAG: hypothetical protein ACYC4N_31280 [Pirellulaceae bacterium]
MAYVRAWQVNPKASGLDAVNPDGWIAVGRRSIGRAVSKDFRHFGKPEIVVSTGADMAPSHLYQRRSYSISDVLASILKHRRGWEPQERFIAGILLYSRYAS